MDGTFVVGDLAGNQLLGGIAGERQTPLADKVHLPSGRIPAAVRHPGQVGHQHSQPAVSLSSGFLDLLALADVLRKDQRTGLSGKEKRHGRELYINLVAVWRYQGRLHARHRRARLVQPAHPDRTGDAALVTVSVPTAEAPQYAIDIGDLTGGRRLLSDDVATLEAVANLSAIALDNARMHRTLQYRCDLMAAHKNRIDDN